MKNLCRMSVLALFLVGVGFAQQEVSPDRFEFDGAKQPVKVKTVAKANHSAARMEHTKRRPSNKAVNKTVLSARNTAGN